MTKLQRLTLFTGCLGICLNVISLTFHLSSFGYCALFVSRLSGFLYMVCLDRMRYVYLIPATVSLLNAYYQTEFLVFAELLSASVIYQVSAFNIFLKK